MVYGQQQSVYSFSYPYVYLTHLTGSGNIWCFVSTFILHSPQKSEITQLQFTVDKGILAACMVTMTNRHGSVQKEAAGVLAPNVSPGKDLIGIWVRESPVSSIPRFESLRSLTYG